MAVQKPDTGVVRLERDGDVATSWHEYHVPAWRVDEVKALVAVDRIEGGILLPQDNHVHAVPVQWVGHYHEWKPLAKDGRIRATEPY